MGKPLSATMVACIDFAREHGEIVRFAGGFWTKRGAGWSGSHPDTEWFGSSTVQACVTRGELQYTEFHNGRYRAFPVAVALAKATPHA